jgi:hypothetical protein
LSEGSYRIISRYPRLAVGPKGCTVVILSGAKNL